MEDPTAFHLAYSSFPLIRMAPPQLHQPTLATKELTQSPVNKTDEDAHDKSKAPVRVTRPPNAYLLFNKEMRKILKDQDPTMKVADISKEVGFRWKTMPKEQKDQYVIQANKLKEEQKALHPNAMYMRRSRAELVKAGHVTKGSSKDQPKRKRPKRDKNSSTPKHPLSAYMWYLTEVRPETMRNYPGSNVGQISKLCADRWNNMTEEDRLPWKTKAQVDKERYAREMQIYAIQNDHALGRGTRQKYRAAALKHELSSFMDPFCKTIQPQSSLQPSLLINAQPLSPSNSMLLPMNHTPRTLNTLLPSDPFVNNNC
ncbi:hypothetical protein CU098_008076 [Rhizopus stolonifer]|uniref:HMG box domain-containing protein n=2 Tax=Mucorineae TaxID=1344963 RepID=A0A367J1I8_RHIST|nr:hypothetical protein CU098_008076 [Rhizopus stolonifer]